MRLWTIQPKEIYEILKQDGVFHCDPSRSTCLTEMNFGHGTRWTGNIKSQIYAVQNSVANRKIVSVWKWKN